MPVKDILVPLPNSVCCDEPVLDVEGTGNRVTCSLCKSVLAWRIDYEVVEDRTDEAAGQE